MLHLFLCRHPAAPPHEPLPRPPSLRRAQLETLQVSLHLSHSRCLHISHLSRSLPAFSLNSNSTVMRYIASSLITPAHVFSPALLYNISHLRTQHAFTQAVLSFIETIALGPSSILESLPTLPEPRGSPQPLPALHASSVLLYTCRHSSHRQSPPNAVLHSPYSQTPRRGVKAPPDHPIYCNATCAYYSEFKPHPAPMPLLLSPRALSVYTTTAATQGAAARCATTRYFDSSCFSFSRNGIAIPPWRIRPSPQA